MDHTESIVHIKGVVNDGLIKKIIPLIKQKAKNNLEVYDGKRTDIRNVKGCHLNFTTPTKLFYWNLIKIEIQRLYIYYSSKFPKMNLNKINQIDLLKYEVGGKYEIHTDAHTNINRFLSVIINLNDEYEGGDLVFTDQKEKEIKRLKLEKGSIVFFPSNFMYPHGIQPITKGTRYSIVAWLQ
jgi:predicted 2-oxoglutarate/Fe(II)-dependent dioxygenase YbiX